MAATLCAKRPTIAWKRASRPRRSHLALCVLQLDAQRCKIRVKTRGARSCAVVCTETGREREGGETTPTMVFFTPFFWEFPQNVSSMPGGARCFASNNFSELLG